MSGAIVLIFLLFAIGIPLVLWVAIEGETSEPTVVDRTEAERLAREQGGRGRSGTGPDASGRATADRDHTDDRDEEPRWGTESDDRWGAQSDDSNRDDRWR